MVSANINALYSGSLRIKILYFISEKLTFYKLCVTKVAHCSVDPQGNTSSHQGIRQKQVK